MGSVVKDIGNGLSGARDFVDNSTKKIGGSTANALGIHGDLGYLMSEGPTTQYERFMAGLGGNEDPKDHKQAPVKNSLGYHEGDIFTNPNFFKKPETPQEKLQKSQLAQQKEFQQNIPQMQKQMGDQLRSQYNTQLQGNMKSIQASNQRRGMAYGGLNYGQQQGEAAREQANLATGLGNINTGLENANQQMMQQALQTGVGIQSTNQQIQNQLYSQEMARLQAQNSMTGNIMGTMASMGLMAAML